MTFKVWCEVRGGVAPQRRAWVKDKEGKALAFSTIEEARAACPLSRKEESGETVHFGVFEIATEGA